MLEKFFINFLSTAFHSEFTNRDDFINKYETYEQIEKDIDPFFNDRIIFDIEDYKNRNLRSKIEEHYLTQPNISEFLKDEKESTIFVIATYSWLSAIIDQLMVSIKNGLIPYIRFEITFHYLVLVMYTFINDEYLRNTIEKTIVFYVFRKSIPENLFHKKNFEQYADIIKGKQLLENIILQIRFQNIDIFKGGLDKVSTIVMNEISPYIHSA